METINIHPNGIQYGKTWYPIIGLGALPKEVLSAMQAIRPMMEALEEIQVYLDCCADEQDPDDPDDSIALAKQCAAALRLAKGE